MGPDIDFQQAGHVGASIDRERESIRNNALCGWGKTGNSSTYAINECMWAGEMKEYQWPRPMKVGQEIEFRPVRNAWYTFAMQSSAKCYETLQDQAGWSKCCHLSSTPSSARICSNILKLLGSRNKNDWTKPNVRLTSLCSTSWLHQIKPIKHTFLKISSLQLCLYILLSVAAYPDLALNGNNLFKIYNCFS